MPRGRKPTGERTLTGAERQARYRQRQVGNRAVPPPRPSRPIQRSNRVQQWHAAVATLVALQAEYAVWLDALPEALRDGATVGLQPAGLTRGERCRQSSISISTSWSASSHRAALAEIDGYRPHPLHSQLDPKTVLVTSPPTTRWETPPRPPSDRNGGRFQIGMGGRFQSEYPAGFIGIRTQRRLQGQHRTCQGADGRPNAGGRSAGSARRSRSGRHDRSSPAVPVLRRPHDHCRGRWPRRRTPRPAIGRRRDQDLIR